METWNMSRLRDLKNESLYKNTFQCKPVRNRNQSTDLHCKSIDLFPQSKSSPR